MFASSNRVMADAGWGTQQDPGLGSLGLLRPCGGNVVSEGCQAAARPLALPLKGGEIIQKATGVLQKD